MQPASVVVFDNRLGKGVIYLVENSLFLLFGDKIKMNSKTRQHKRQSVLLHIK